MEVPVEYRGVVRSRLQEVCERFLRELSHRGVRVLSLLQFTASKPTVVLVLGNAPRHDSIRIRGSIVLQETGEQLEFRGSRAISRRSVATPEYRRAAEEFEAALAASFRLVSEWVRPARSEPSGVGWPGLRPRTNAA